MPLNKLYEKVDLVKTDLPNRLFWELTLYTVDDCGMSVLLNEGEARQLGHWLLKETEDDLPER